MRTQSLEIAYWHEARAPGRRPGREIPDQYCDFLHGIQITIGLPHAGHYVPLAVPIRPVNQKIPQNDLATGITAACQFQHCRRNIQARALQVTESAKHITSAACNIEPAFSTVQELSKQSYFVLCS